MIHIDNVTKFYPRQQQPALDSVTLHIPEGSVFGLLGPNGAGKTTLISILVGLQRHNRGEIRFNGKPLEQNLAEVRAMTGFVPQDLAFYPMLTVAENLDFYVAASGVPKAERTQRVAQAVAAAKLEQHYRKSAHALSGGLKRRLNLAIGLLNNPRVLFLDEPTVGIDPQSRNFILDTIAGLNRETGMTLIYTSHYMEEVQQICDQIAIIDGGKILVSGELQALLAAGNSSRLEFRLQQPADTAVVALLHERYQANSHDGRLFEVATGDIAELLRGLPKFLQGHGLVLEGIRYGFRSLEDLYMAHTMCTPRE